MTASPDTPDPTTLASSLTPHELDVLALVGHGHTNREIARGCWASAKPLSVTGCRAGSASSASIGVHRRSAAVVMAVRLGLAPA